MKLITTLALGATLALAQEKTITTNSSFTIISDRAELAVKGAPYSADTVTETVQILGDGNRISRSNKSSFARDSEGRTRRESTIQALGPIGQTESPITSIFIDDPTTKTSFTLDTAHKLAFKSKSEAGMAMMKMQSDKPMGIMQNVIIDRQVPGSTQTKTQAEYIFTQKLQTTSKTAGKKEDLGMRNIEGVMAKGTRFSQTIPAGEVGNERPIEVSTETWYSEEIKAAVLVKHTDPRSGETTTRVSNLRLGEPSKALFEIPSDYKVEEGNSGRAIPAMRIRDDR